MVPSPANAQSTIEARTVHKVRTRIIPFVFVLFVIAVLDRNNIAFAALTMNNELAISTQQYGFIAGIFFFGYFIFEIPSNLLLHRIGARVWIARILITWGIMIDAASLMLLGAIPSRSVLLSVALWCLVAAGSFSLWGPFWSLPNEFLTGFSAAAGIALINCFGNLSGFVAPFAIGAITKKTGSLQTGLFSVGISLLTSPMLILALRKRAPETGAVAMTQTSPAAMPMADLDP